MNAKWQLLRGVVTATAAAAAVVVTSAAPAAAAAIPLPGDVEPDANGWCHYEYWGGTFFCYSQAYWPKPDHYPQVFVVGPNHNVYTRWSNQEGLYNWLNLGGLCLGDPGIAIRYVAGEWGMTVNCKSTDKAEWWHRERFPDGHWTPNWLKGFAYPS